MCLADCRHADGIDGMRHRNMDGEMLSMFCLGIEMCVSDTWLKREEKRKGRKGR